MSYPDVIIPGELLRWFEKTLSSCLNFDTPLNTPFLGKCTIKNGTCLVTKEKIEKGARAVVLTHKLQSRVGYVKDEETLFSFLREWKGHLHAYHESLIPPVPKDPTMVEIPGDLRIYMTLLDFNAEFIPLPYKKKFCGSTGKPILRDTPCVVVRRNGRPVQFVGAFCDVPKFLETLNQSKGNIDRFNEDMRFARSQYKKRSKSG